MSAIWRLVLPLAFAGGLAGCRTLSPKSGDAAADPAPSPSGGRQATTLPIGTIDLVDASGGFVLIRSSRQFQIEPGTMLTVHGDQGEEVATVSVSPARKGVFLTADIVAGMPRKGQQTTMQYEPPAPETSDPYDGGGADPNAIQVLE